MPVPSAGRPPAARRALSWCLTAAIALGVALPGLTFNAAPVQAQTSSNVLPAAAAEVKILSASDRELYQQIFMAQKRRDWATADRLMAQVSDRRLAGYVLYDRYASANGYRTSYTNVVKWMQSYADLPVAGQMYQLGLKLKPQPIRKTVKVKTKAKGKKKARLVSRTVLVPVKSAPLPRPIFVANVSRGGADASNAVAETVRVPLTKTYFKAEKTARARLAQGNGEGAIAYIAAVRPQLSEGEYARLVEVISTSAYLSRQSPVAYAITANVSATGATMAPLLDWYGGLAAWRLQKFDDAAAHFNRLALSDNVNNWTRSGGGFWAARAYMAAEKPQHVADMLELSAKTGPTLYGMISSRLLGRETDITWVEPPLDQAACQHLLNDPSAARAVALSQVDKPQWAEAELVRAANRVDQGLDGTLVALAGKLGLAAVQMQLARAVDVPSATGPNGSIMMNAALYPVPKYKPAGGFEVDPALVYAVARQESSFRAGATSTAGARGLMQIMPATAVHIARTASMNYSGADQLFDPQVNMSMGQQYIKELLSFGATNGNLFMVTSAYNGGPGNLNRWLSSVDYQNDPLLFIESIPMAETRNYIERVVTNFWIYRDRLGSPSRTLDETASGGWPVYDSNSPTGDDAFAAR
ncbi:MAG: lytic transglycosylase domain-containing protein [Parvibaculaceae bacterium]|nr:lytic transglycosylase domain-containing protein [Parvibaculaceae bacterium]